MFYNHEYSYVIHSHIQLFIHKFIMKLNLIYYIYHTMSKSTFLYIVWVITVIFWNFCYPEAKPIYDVFVAILLSIIVKFFQVYWVSRL